ncbi:hypothetical protein EDD85DRAFT_826449 [Armillaria nabsnona]|nr:hypothetical protein EDD85DRAFT_826449 [Armillaria nabsnona]
MTRLWVVCDYFGDLGGHFVRLKSPKHALGRNPSFFSSPKKHPFMEREKNTPNTRTPCFLRCIHHLHSPRRAYQRLLLPSPVLFLHCLCHSSSLHPRSFSVHSPQALTFAVFSPSLLLSIERVPLHRPFFIVHSLEVIYCSTLLSFCAVVSFSLA